MKINLIIIMKASTLKFLFNIYPPLLFSGIKVKRISSDFKEIDVQLKLSWYNRNYVKTMFGGSLFSMTDPFYMVMLMNILGKDFVVWDKSACIDFIKPGKGKVFAKFRIDDETLKKIIENSKNLEKYYPEFVVDIINENNETIARVKKILYVKKKNNNF